MSAFESLHGAQEQICYVKCCFCNTILLVLNYVFFSSFLFLCLCCNDLIVVLFYVMKVSVPYSSLAMVVTIRCGHCNDIFSLNMMKFFSLIDQHQMVCKKTYDQSLLFVNWHDICFLVL